MRQAPLTRCPLKESSRTQSTAVTADQCASMTSRDRTALVLAAQDCGVPLASASLVPRHTSSGHPRSAPRSHRTTWHLATTPQAPCFGEGEQPRDSRHPTFTPHLEPNHRGPWWSAQSWSCWKAASPPPTFHLSQCLPPRAWMTRSTAARAGGSHHTFLTRELKIQKVALASKGGGRGRNASAPWCLQGEALVSTRMCTHTKVYMHTHTCARTHLHDASTGALGHMKKEPIKVSTELHPITHILT